MPRLLIFSIIASIFKKIENAEIFKIAFGDDVVIA